MKAIGYARVSTQEQGDDGAGMKAQRRAIAEAVEARGWSLIGIEEDVRSGGSTNGRHGLERALKALDAGEAEVLVVAKLDRLSRSLLDFARMLERSRKRGWSLVSLDLGLDTSTPVGEMTAGTLMVFAQFERRRIGERIKEALAERKADGVRLGRPPVLPGELVDRIRAMREDGLSLHGIARTLNDEEVPTAHGGSRWHAATVKRIVDRV